jgi:dTDP-4-amino-4,6-dideoxygalactose transaminase
MKIQATETNFSKNDIEFILDNFKKILKGESYLSQYKFSSYFEEKFSECFGAKYAISCNSGTSALELIFRSIKVKGKEVILPSNTFVATANAIMNAGGVLKFADCDDSMCLDYESVISKISKNTIAVCHVHIGGVVSSGALRLAKFCKENKIWFVEDAAQAHGSMYKGTYAGSIGDAAGFSFYSTKVMTTGEGGMVTTNNNKIKDSSISLREFGKNPNGIYTNIYTNFGYNWRMQEVSALMGIRQIKSLENNIKKRREIAFLYDKLLSEISGVELIGLKYRDSYNGFKYIIKVNRDIRDKLHLHFLDNGIQPSGYVYEFPLHKMKLFSNYNSDKLPMTEDFCATHFCLPIYPTMTKLKIDKVCKVLESFFKSLEKNI